MPIVSFNYTKINAERYDFAPGPTNIKNNVVIKEVTKTKLALGAQSQDVLRIMFEFITFYEPRKGKISLEGEILHLDKPEKIEVLAKAWQKDKKLPKDETRILMNHVLNKCNVEAILMSREINLPSPVQLPSLGK
jgi:hypothetical protein